MFHSNLFFPHKEPVCQVWEEGPVIRGVPPLLEGPSVILAVWKVGMNSHGVLACEGVSGMTHLLPVADFFEPFWSLHRFLQRGCVPCSSPFFAQTVCSLFDWKDCKNLKLGLLPAHSILLDVKTYCGWCIPAVGRHAPMPLSPRPCGRQGSRWWWVRGCPCPQAAECRDKTAREPQSCLVGYICRVLREHLAQGAK